MAKRLGWYIPKRLVLKITLAGSKPRIWRRVEVDSGLTLHDLHYVIQTLFGWTNSHLYQFIVPPGGELARKAMVEAIRFSAHESHAEFEASDDLPADEAMLGRVFTDDLKQIVYEYDFGDSWEHIVKLEKRSPDGDPNHIPVCLAGENAAPPEDSGGIFGFYDFLAAYDDKKHELHEDARNWLGKRFDPAKFDLDAVNKQLRSMFTPKPKKPRKTRKKPE